MLWQSRIKVPWKQKVKRNIFGSEIYKSFQEKVEFATELWKKCVDSSGQWGKPVEFHTFKTLDKSKETELPSIQEIPPGLKNVTRGDDGDEARKES